MLTFEKLESTSDTMKQIVLLGENQAGHERKVKFMDFAGEIEIHAERVHLQAESWMEKQMAQGAGFWLSKEVWTKVAHFSAFDSLVFAIIQKYQEF